MLKLDAPGRDITVNAVDEVFTEVSAEDDYGLRQVEIVWSVNGGAERSVALLSAASGRRPKQTSGSHTFYLEEEELEPGDFISYYARATDDRNAAEPQETATDIFFMQIMPFRRDYSQAPSGGGGGGGGPQVQLAERQRQIVTATFKIARDQDDMRPSQVAEDLEMLAMMQSELRQQTMGAAAQMGSAGQGDMLLAVEYLRTAAGEMERAEARLGEQDAKQALEPEQRALQQLQRLQAMMREMQIALGQAGGGGGGGDLQQIAEALDFDTDELQNQYESVQRQRQETAGNQVDEALQRLTELGAPATAGDRASAGPGFAAATGPGWRRQPATDRRAGRGAGATARAPGSGAVAR